MAEQEQGDIRQEYNSASFGLDQDHALNQIKKGSLTYALNANVENFDANGISYQNEISNEFCVSFPEGFVLIGNHFIGEKNKHIFMLANPTTGDSHIGYMDNNDCTYRIYIDDPCLGFDVNYPIHKIVHKVTNCTTEIYWPDKMGRRFLDLENIPYLLKENSTLCDPRYSTRVDCNQLKMQPNFPIPSIEVIDVVSGGNLIAGTIQFGVQYSDANSNGYTSYYSITNPTPISDPNITTPNFNYPVGKSVIIDVSNLDVTGHYQYFNLVAIKTINAVSTPELVGTYFIDAISKQITYTGQGVDNIKLSMMDIFEKFPYYDLAEDVTAVQDILIWDNLTSVDRINYQSIWSKVNLQWESWRIPATESYADEVNATNFRSFLRDEVYAVEGVFLLRNGRQTDRFHIPGRLKRSFEINSPDVPTTNNDFIGEPDYKIGDVGYSPYWKIYNTATVTGMSEGYSSDPKYKGAYQYGEFAYWESTDEYPCDEAMWGDLAGQKIRHHKFPDVLVSPINESRLFYSADSMVMGNDAIFPIGIKIDLQEISALINFSNLTKEQKADIIGFKIVRGDRSTNKSIVAKGILRNVGIYEREEQKFYFPNYPYNDLSADPFLTSTNNAFDQICDTYAIDINTLAPDSSGGPSFADVQYTDCNTNKLTVKRFLTVDSFPWCSITKPVILSPAEGNVSTSSYEIWFVWNSSAFAGWRVGWIDPLLGETNKWLCAYVYNTCDESATIHVVKDTGGPKYLDGKGNVRMEFRGYSTPGKACNSPVALNGIKDNTDLKYRQIFNSPETSFGQPFLGDTLKLESIIFGKGSAHFAEVKNNAKYKLLTEDAQRKALDSSNALGAITSDFNASAMFAAYQSYLTIYTNGITRKNFAYSFNSIADYNYNAMIPNDLGIKQRNLDIARYLVPGVQSVNDDFTINNYERESSIYLRTNKKVVPLPFPDESPNSTIQEKSRFTISDKGNCNKPGKEESIQVISYYASIKNNISNQWGQVYSYDSVDTGFQRYLNSDVQQSTTIFGGDTFICRFAFKTKLPFFIDNRVGAPDDSDIFYDEIGNIAYPKYWHSARSILKDYMSTGGLLSNIISFKAHNFDCPNDGIYSAPVSDYSGISTTSTSSTTTTTTTSGDLEKISDLTYYDGYFYLFAYGIPNFYCESSYNTDLRQAFNSKEGNFWPHVSTSIPDEWVQEHNVSIANDNTYYYNSTYSKQNKENTFTHLPPDWEEKLCYTKYPFRGIYSDKQVSEASNRVNNWLNYAPASYFDFPQTYGKLVSLDGIQNKAILARFENKSLLYNSLLTVNTSNPQAAYFGNPDMFKGAPPIDFAETDLGYVGSQHKMLLKIPQGQVTIDAKRGQIFLITGTQVNELTGFGCGMNRFFTDHLAFEILRYFPDVDTDNAYNGIGLHGVYDSKFDRVIFTKLDYIPLYNTIGYDSIKNEFYNKRIVNNVVLKDRVYLTDQEFFCNKSWTLSYNLNTKSWISFHSYIPNWYIAENNFFYSGKNNCCYDFDVILGVPIDEVTTTSTTTLPCLLNAKILNAFPTTTTTSTTIQEFFMCEIAGLHFDYYSNNLVGHLTIGNVVANPGVVVGDYLIEWRIGTNVGPIVLITGIGIDPLIQILHPFTDEPVESGILFPVIKYIYLDGIKYSPYISVGDRFSYDLIQCLPEAGIYSITVENINCAYINLDPDNQYTYELAYTNTIDPDINASRSIRFYLNMDGSTKLLACGFGGMDVVDRVVMSYVSMLDENNPILLTNWAVGQNAVVSSYDYSGGIAKMQGIKYLTNFENIFYTIGDYILINVIPRIYEPTNTNTNWILFLKCLPTFENYITPIGARTMDVSTLEINYISGDCMWEFSWKNMEDYIIPSWFIYTNLYPGWNISTNRYSDYFQNRIDGNTQYVSYSSVCNNLLSNLNITKTGNNILLTFGHIDDYNLFKNDFNITTSNANWTNYSSDITDINHYKFWYFPVKIATLCGDTTSEHVFTCHYNSTLVWNDIDLTLSIDMVNTINGIISTGVCDFLPAQIDNLISSAQFSIDESNYSINTHILQQFNLRNWYMLRQSIVRTYSRNSYGLVDLSYSVYNHHVMPSDWRDLDNGYGILLSSYSIEILDMDDVPNNFRITNYLNPDGTELAIGEVILEIIGGVQIVP